MWLPGCAYHSLIADEGARGISEREARLDRAKALELALELQRRYNRNLNVMDWSATAGRIAAFVTASLGTGLVSSGGADDLANIGRLLPYTALSAVVLEAVNRGFEIDRRQDIYGRATSVIDCAIRATTPTPGPSAAESPSSTAVSGGQPQPSEADLAAALYGSLLAIHASVQAELSHAQLGEGKSVQPADTAGAFPDLDRRIRACLTRLVVNVGS